MSREEQEAAEAVAIDAGSLVMGYFRKALGSRRKSPTSFVTEADERSEEHIRLALGQAFPGEPVLGEEGGLEGEPERAWWAVDPLDGTTNFMSGIPLFSVSIARIVDGRPVLGVIHEPLSGETFTAVREGGAYLSGRRLFLRGTDPGLPTVLSVPHKVLRRHRLDLRRLGTDKLRSLGTACTEMAWVATGRLNGVVAHEVQLWDIAAGALIVEEAGGLVCDLDQEPLFPLQHPPSEYVERRLSLFAGDEPVVGALLQAWRPSRAGDGEGDA